jgi:crossover junction endodeoxyribonuclease RusA
MDIEFFVPGKPAQQGSKRHVGRGIMVESNPRLKDWRASVALAGRIAMTDDAPVKEPVHIVLEFVFSRPNSHFTKKGLRPDAPAVFTNAPDLDKLVRAIGDALTGIVWNDDRQIWQVVAKKLYGDKPGCLIRVRS